MAWYDANRNRGYNTYGLTDPVYGGRAIVGYATTAERYVATSEQVVEYGSYPGRPSPTRMELYKDIPGAGENPLLRPWNTTHDRPKKGDKISPRLSQGQGSSPRNGDKISPRLSQGQGSSPRKGDKISPSLGQGKGSAWNNVHWDNSPPSRDHYGKYNNNCSSDDDDGSDEDDVICKDGVCYPNPKHNKGEDYDGEKLKGNGYGPSNYSVPRLIQPSNDPYYTKSYPDNYTHMYKGGYSPPSSYTAPVATQPRRDTHYETSKPDNYKGSSGYGPHSYTAPVTPRNDSYYEASNNRPVVHDPPPPIKTRPATSKGVEYSGENTKNSPASVGSQQSPFTPSPKKEQGYNETIDSAEARRRYGRAPSGPGAQAEQKYAGTIDSKEAARKYSGVFVPY